MRRQRGKAERSRTAENFPPLARARDAQAAYRQAREARGDALLDAAEAGASLREIAAALGAASHTHIWRLVTEAEKRRYPEEAEHMQRYYALTAPERFQVFDALERFFRSTR